MKPSPPTVIGCNEVTVVPIKNLSKTLIKLGPPMLLIEFRADRSKFYFNCFSENPKWRTANMADIKLKGCVELRLGQGI